MRALLQRVTQASVSVEGRATGAIGAGLLILNCAIQGDTPAQADKIATKIAKLRIFKDAAGKMNRSIRDIQGSACRFPRGSDPGFPSTTDSP